ncbi:glycosyltransferase family 2 protein [Chloroflexota bacterium]
MKVSVIVPTYNRAHMVTETIDSILTQTCPDFELIIIDNESTDNTEAVINSYTDERIRYFKHQNNGVVAVNRNYGIGKAQGEYIAFCDDDDLWMQEKLEKQLLGFGEDSQIGLVCTNAINFDKDGEHGKLLKTKLKDRNFQFEELIWRNRIIGPSVMVRKEAIGTVGLLDESPEIFTVEDYELWLRIAKQYKIKYIDLPLIKYRTHPGAYSKNYSERKTLEIVICRKLLDKGIIGSDLYQKRINRSNREILILKLLRYKWAIECTFSLVRVFLRITNGIRKLLGRDTK